MTTPNDGSDPGHYAGQYPGAGEPQPQYGQPQPDPWGSQAPQYGQPQYGQPQYGQPQYGQPQYGQPQYGQPQYGQPPFGGPPQPPYGGYPGGPAGGPPKKSNTGLIIGIVTAVVVILAAVGIGILAFGGSDDKDTAGTTKTSAGNSSAPKFPSSSPSSSATRSSRPTGTSTTSPTPSSTRTTSTEPCAYASASFSLIDFNVTASFVRNNAPTAYQQNIITKCVAADQLANAAKLYGKQFSLPGTDTTGGNGRGPTAKYHVTLTGGGSVDYTLTKHTADAGYGITAIVINP
jgi:hypothetical protein